MTNPKQKSQHRIDELDKLIEFVRTSAKQNEREHKQFLREMNALKEEFGGHQRTLSEIVEDAVYQKLSQERKLGGVAFKSIAKNVRDFTGQEYDIVLQNGTYTALIEVKQKARSKDITKLLEKQVGSLREGFRLPKNQRIIAGIAGRVIPDDVKKEAEKKGVVIITQNGGDITFANSPGFKPKAY